MTTLPTNPRVVEKKLYYVVCFPEHRIAAYNDATCNAKDHSICGTPVWRRQCNTLCFASQFSKGCSGKTFNARHDICYLRSKVTLRFAEHHYRRRRCCVKCTYIVSLCFTYKFSRGWTANTFNARHNVLLLAKQEIIVVCGTSLLRRTQCNTLCFCVSDPNIPETGEQQTRSTHATTCCFTHCKGHNLCIRPSSNCAPGDEPPSFGDNYCTSGHTVTTSSCSHTTSSSSANCVKKPLNLLLFAIVITVAHLLLTLKIDRLLLCRKRTTVRFK